MKKSHCLKNELINTQNELKWNFCLSNTFSISVFKRVDNENWMMKENRRSGMNYYNCEISKNSANLQKWQKENESRDWMRQKEIEWETFSLKGWKRVEEISEAISFKTITLQSSRLPLLEIQFHHPSSFQVFVLTFLGSLKFSSSLPSLLPLSFAFFFRHTTHSSLCTPVLCDWSKTREREREKEREKEREVVLLCGGDSIHGKAVGIRSWKWFFFAFPVFPLFLFLYFQSLSLSLSLSFSLSFQSFSFKTKGIDFFSSQGNLSLSWNELSTRSSCSRFLSHLLPFNLFDSSLTGLLPVPT